MIPLEPPASLGGVHLRSRGRLDFLKLGQRTQAGRLGVTGAAAGSGKHRKGGNNECGEYADHKNGWWFWRKIQAFRRFGQMELIWLESHKSACSGRERRTGSRKRRKARQTRRSGRLSSVGKSGLFVRTGLIVGQIWAETNCRHCSCKAKDSYHGSPGSLDQLPRAAENRCHKRAAP